MAYYERYEPDETGALRKVVYNCGVGFCLPYYGEAAPPGTLACDGSEISREAYKELFKVLGTKAGAGDGSTTFNLPDLRGDFIRCVGGNAAELGVEQGDAIRNFISSFDVRGWTSNNTAGASIGTQIVANGGGWIYEVTGAGRSVPTAGNSYFNDVLNSRIVFDPSRVVPTAAENRPVNVALLWCIIYE